MKRSNISLILLLLIIVFFLNYFLFSIFCSQPSTSSSDMHTGNDVLNHKLLIILVMSAPNNRERRDVIRQTWMTTVTNDVFVYFVVGTKDLNNNLFIDIKDEHRVNEDMLLLEDLKDSYFKLTEKLVAALTIVSRKHNSTYVMKCDDDTFIDGARFLKSLSLLPTSKLYWGYFTGAAHVKKSGPWAEPNFHLCDRYLPYARGGGYVITWDIVLYIINNFAMLQVYNSEDVTIGVWLAPLNIKRAHSTAFDTEATSRGCLNHHFVSHKQSIEELQAKHRSLKSTGRLCDQESSLRPEYTYNWSVPPSKCCIK